MHGEIGARELGELEIRTTEGEIHQVVFYEGEPSLPFRVSDVYYRGGSSTRFRSALEKARASLKP